MDDSSCLKFSVQELKEVWQATKLMLFSAVSGMVSCPLAMTDGAATTLTKLLQQHQHCSPGISYIRPCKHVQLYI